MSDKTDYDKLLSKLKKNKPPFNSDNMDQMPFKFFEKDEDESLRGEDKKRFNFAKKYFDSTCGWLHLGWDVDAYWSMVAEKVMIPNVAAIYNELVRLDHSEQNPFMWGDADGDIFYIPTENPNTKIVVHTTQCRDYLYILTGTKQNKLRELLCKDNHFSSIHIRRIWKNWDSMHEYHQSGLKKLFHGVANTPESLKKIDEKEFIQTILKDLPCYEEISDDHYQYSRRHSLEYYRKRNFEMRSSNPFNGIYGDSRDGGFIFSMDCGPFGRRAENTASQFNQLELISTCYLPGILSELGIDNPSEWISKNQ